MLILLPVRSDVKISPARALGKKGNKMLRRRHNNVLGFLQWLKFTFLFKWKHTLTFVYKMFNPTIFH